MTFLLGRTVGFDRDRAFYPVILIVIAWYYVLFAVMGGSTRAIISESVVMTIFVVTAIVGFKLSEWIVALGIAGHGVFDSIHGSLISNPGMPRWWPAFCGTIDIAIAAGLVWLILHGRRSADAK